MNCPTESARVRRAILTSLLGALTWALPVAAEPPPTATLEIVVENVASDEGVLRIAVSNSADQFDGDGDVFAGDGEVVIRDGRAERVFEDVPHGTYAVKVFHDENGNGDLDTNFVGYPTEGFGFSNDAMGRFGPPSFEDASFEVDAEPTRITITLR